MEKKLTIKEQYEKIEKSLIRRGIEVPNKPKTIRSSNLEKIQEYNKEVTRERRSQGQKKAKEIVDKMKEEQNNELLNDFEEMSENLSNNPNELDETVYDFEWSDTIIKNYFKEAFETPERGGSKYILKWLENLRNKMGDSKVAELLQKAAEDMVYFTRERTYKAIYAADWVRALHEMWYKYGQTEEEFETEEDYQEFMKETYEAIRQYLEEDDVVDFYE